MSTITVFESVSLDGVMQAPGRADEDTRNGFAHGGWSNGYQDDISMGFAAEGMTQDGALLFGRRTYEDLLGFWSAASFENPFSDVLSRKTKYVVSRDASTKPVYPNSHLLAGDAPATVKRLRDGVDLDLTILGSGELVRSLHAAGLIDRYILLIHPIVLGSGTSLFGPADRVDLDLERALPTTTGVVIASYRVRG
ncbi:dihydrofolate reductase family protein [Microbacterium sp. DT81.1]|uniref:dihydrofolate reductase family protein n=1 Tax=Microbacterium sp. DT81.1 TaxID=3393413 RepID=UPI003CE8F16B